MHYGCPEETLSDQTPTDKARHLGRDSRRNSVEPGCRRRVYYGSCNQAQMVCPWLSLLLWRESLAEPDAKGAPTVAVIEDRRDILSLPVDCGKQLREPFLVARRPIHLGRGSCSSDQTRPRKGLESPLPQRLRFLQKQSWPGLEGRSTLSKWKRRITSG